MHVDKPDPLNDDGNPHFSMQTNHCYHQFTHTHKHMVDTNNHCSLHTRFIVLIAARKSSHAIYSRYCHYPVCPFTTVDSRVETDRLVTLRMNRGKKNNAIEAPYNQITVSIIFSEKNETSLSFICELNE